MKNVDNIIGIKTKKYDFLSYGKYIGKPLAVKEKNNVIAISGKDYTHSFS
ncbi:MAG: hypothetical protein ACI30B_00150 [Paludibacteraceae bacterium]